MIEEGEDGGSSDLPLSETLLPILRKYDPHQTSQEESAEVLRKIVLQQKRVLSAFDLHRRPERFFEAHRMLADEFSAGFGIRFTVQYNLFCGSILGLGTDEQAKQMLRKVEEEGLLGSFALTEASAGVLSGLIVHTR